MLKRIPIPGKDGLYIETGPRVFIEPNQQSVMPCGLADAVQSQVEVMRQH